MIAGRCHASIIASLTNSGGDMYRGRSGPALSASRVSTGDAAVSGWQTPLLKFSGPAPGIPSYSSRGCATSTASALNQGRAETMYDYLRPKCKTCGAPVTLVPDGI